MYEWRQNKRLVLNSGHNMNFRVICFNANIEKKIQKWQEYPASMNIDYFMNSRRMLYIYRKTPP